MVDPVAVIPLKSGGKVSVPMARLETGDKVVIINTIDGARAALQLNPLSVGDKVVVVNAADGSRVVVPLNLSYSGSCMSRGYSVAYGDVNYKFVFWVKADPGEHTAKVTVIYGVGENPEYNLVWESSTISEEWTEVILGNPLPIATYWFSNVKFEATGRGAFYFDQVYFQKTVDPFTVDDLMGYGGFEIGDSNWDLQGKSAIIESAGSHEGTHCLKLL